MAFYNNPAFGQAASNIAAMFAPPSGADASGWASAKAKQDEAQRLKWLFDNYGDPSASQRSALTGVQTYGATPEGFKYNVDEGNATQRYGYDTQAATSLTNNAADNARAIQTNTLDNQRSAIGTLFQPLNPGQVRPDVPADFMDALGLPEAAAVAGAPKPLSETEVKGGLIQGLDPELQAAIAFGSTPVENIVTPEGPRVSTRLDAIGQEPVINKGAEASPKLVNYQTPDGHSGSALFDPTTQTLYDASTRQPLPEGTRTYTGQLSGGTDDTGFGLTNSTASRIQQQIIALDQTLDTAKTLRDMVEQSPSSQGLVGALRGTAQDIVQTGGDLGQFFGGQVEEVNKAVREGLLDAGVAAENFDPNIPAIEMLSNLLAWQYAKSLSGDRVSNEQLKQAREALGGTGLFANRANTLTRLDQLIGAWGRQREQLGPMAPGVHLGEPSTPGGTVPARAGGIAEGTIIQNDAGAKMIRRGGKWEPM